MSALTFRLKEPPRQPLDMAPLTPAVLAGKSRAEIAGIELQCGNRKLAVGTLFDLSGENSEEIVIDNACDNLDNVGRGLESGNLTVNGDVGAYLGCGMKGGRILVRGSCGAYAAAAMEGGTLEVTDHAGDFLGAPLPGDRAGLAGGLVHIRGNAGDRTGDRMRRGTILIEGNVGACCGSRMVAGTIAVLGRVGALPGFAMKRGTLLLARAPTALPATFNDCGEHEFLFMRLLQDSWGPVDGPFGKAPFGTRLRRHVGDLSAEGRGEILVPA